MTNLPPDGQTLYNQELRGIYGELGGGTGVDTFFVQTALRPNDLDKASLISEIPGSERWGVRDLFQREVDQHRVTRGILPYFEDASKTKFFNPLTLTLLPVDEMSHQILADIPAIEPREDPEDDTQWIAHENEGYFRLRHIADLGWANLAWNDSNTRLVAIDGQHRLSALKRLRSDPIKAQEVGLRDWSIPVVVVMFRSSRTDDTAHDSRLLDVVRSIFVYINTEARTPSRAKKILLDDESVNAIATQELLQRSHQNDLLSPGRRDESVLPLLFFDWRGEEEDGRAVPAPAAVKPIGEVFDWFETYILGEDFGDDQKVALGAMDPTQPLHELFIRKKLPIELADDVRAATNDSVVAGVSHLLENFDPYREYTRELRKLEAELRSESDIARHAFYHLRFGSSQAPEPLKDAVRLHLQETVEDITDLKHRWLDFPLDLDIGMRGIVAAFGEFKPEYDRVTERAAEWVEYSEWFTSILNRVFADGWLSPPQGSPRRRLLCHIVEDQNETVVNYRLGQAADALGAYVALLVARYADDFGVDPEKSDKIEELEDRLRSCWVRGFKKEVRPQLKQEYPQGGRALTTAVREEAEGLAEEQLVRLEETPNDWVMTEAPMDHLVRMLPAEGLAREVGRGLPVDLRRHVEQADASLLAKLCFAKFGPEVLSDRRIRRLLIEALSIENRALLVASLGLDQSTKPYDVGVQISAMPWRAGSRAAVALTAILGLSDSMLPVRGGAHRVVEVIEPTTPPPSLFDYQDEVVGVAATLLDSENSVRFLIQLPTGSGKTRVAMEALREYLVHRQGNGTVVWLAHTEELCEQAIESFRRVWESSGSAPKNLVRFWGNYSPSDEELNDAVIVASYAKAVSTAQGNGPFAGLLRQIDILVCDEAHKALAPTISSLIDVAMKNGGCSLVGLTATPGRQADSRVDNRALARLFDGRLISAPSLGSDPIGTLQRRGILSRVRLEVVRTGVDLDSDAYEAESDVTARTLRSLSADRMRNSLLLDAVAEQVVQGRPTLVFCCTVEHARMLAIESALRGISASSVDCQMSRGSRQRTVQGYKLGRTQVLFNFAVLGTGFDAPNTGSVVIGRPTGSVVLYSQMIGRGLRGTAVGGTPDFILIDVRDNHERFGEVAGLYRHFQDYWTES